MASLSRGISFRRQGSSGLSWTDTWSFNEDGELVRKLKDEHQQAQRFAGSSLSRIHDSTAINEQEGIPEEQASSQTSLPPSTIATAPSSISTLERSKSVGASQALPPRHQQKSSPSIFRLLKKAFRRTKK